MANCLKTQLKSQATNDNLVKFGELIFHVKAASSPSDNDKKLTLYSLTANKISVKDGTAKIASSAAELISNPKSYLDIPATTTTDIYVKNEDFDLVLKDKYNLSEIKILQTDALVSLNIDDLAWSPLNIIFINGNNNIGNIKNVAHAKQINLRAINQLIGDLSCFNGKAVGKGTQFQISVQLPAPSKITGDIKYLKDIVSAQIDVSYISGIEGNIVNLSSKTNLTKLNVNGTNVSGSINALAEAMIADSTAPRTSGTLVIIGNGITTYKVGDIDTPFSGNKTITFSNGSYTIS